MAKRQTQVAAAVSEAVNGKKPSKVVQVLSVAERVTQTLDGFAEFQSAQGTLDNAKAAWDAARKGCRANIKAAFDQYESGKEWGDYLRDLRAGLVDRGIVANAKKARELVDNQLIALKLTGYTERAGQGGARDGAGRPEQEDAKQTQGVLSEKEATARLVAALAWVSAMQAKHAGDGDLLEDFADGARILNGDKRK